MSRPRASQAKNIDAGPIAYASHLARYIRSPDTIFARTKTEFGSAPSLRDIDRMIARHRPKPVLVQEPDDTRMAVEWRPKPMPGFETFNPPAVVRQEAKASPDQRPVFAAPVGGIETAPVTPIEIITSIAKAFHLTAEDITGRRRMANIVHVRNLCAYVLHDRGNKYTDVGRKLGGRDHSTIIYAIEQFKIRARPIDWEIAARHRRARVVVDAA